MANLVIGSSTGGAFGGEYQVFLSYKTRDTGPGFTNSLYHDLVDAGIHVFLDDEELRSGESFTGSLLQALNDSKIYIPIFSENYASSHWCLDEFAKIMENTSKSKDGNKKVILPIYYGVTPDDVAADEGKYSKAISELEKQMENQKKKLSAEEVEKWRRALREFNNTRGWELNKFKGDGDLSESVVNEVVDKLWIKQRRVTKDFVGMEDQMADINNLLDTGPGGEYQVFLGFVGSDTHRGFTNALYHALVKAGIRVFIDDEESQLDEIERAVDDSKIYIPIFSPKFPSSPWCLKELARMAENTSKSKEDVDKKVMLPIFYDVEPIDVRLQTNLYSDAILNLEQRNNSDDVKMWRQALREVSGLKGFCLKNYTGDGNLSKSVVKEVVDRLRKDRSKDVRLIGIYGMPGIGKTTLAKYIFNKQYHRFKKYCSFLDDVSETAKTKGLIELQKQLLSDVSNSRLAWNIEKVDHGTNIIGETICNKKVLIFLDDVDDVNQIQELVGMDSLCPGTRILVTTRDKRVLKMRGFKYEIVPYEMEGLSDKHALQLFSRYAFDDDSPPVDYYALSKGIASTAGGLPLALKVIGSLLFLQEEKKIWEEKLVKLRKTPNRDVLGKLRSSFDALEADEQQIFLDVAYFFIGENKTGPTYMWRDCGFSPEDAIDVLTSRCMMKITYDNRFWMHKQFRDLGRAIATQERSRLWARDDVICELKSTEIKGSVQALCLQSDLLTQPPVTVTSEQIEQFSRIRFLRFSDVTCQGHFIGCLSKLKWITLHYTRGHSGRVCPRFEATNLHLENVVVVNLFGLGFKDDEVSSLIKGARKLKVLTLQESDLRTLELLPSNSTALEPSRNPVKKLTVEGGEFLERLSIIGCERLQVVEGIGELKLLQWLEVKGCGSVERIIDASSSKIPNECEISITDCRKLLDTGRDGSSITWESYREKVLKTNQQKKEKRDERETEQGETNREGGSLWHASDVATSQVNSLPKPRCGPPPPPWRSVHTPVVLLN